MDIKDSMLDPSDDGKKIYFVDQKWALENMEPKVSCHIENWPLTS